MLPILLYVWMVDATEDCFDCFNRSKDNRGGAQALSIFQVVEDDTQADDKESKVAMLKYLNRECYDAEPVKVQDEDITFGQSNAHLSNFGQGHFSMQDPRPQSSTTDLLYRQMGGSIAESSFRGSQRNDSVLNNM